MKKTILTIVILAVSTSAALADISAMNASQDDNASTAQQATTPSNNAASQAQPQTPNAATPAATTDDQNQSPAANAEPTQSTQPDTLVPVESPNQPPSNDNADNATENTTIASVSVVVDCNMKVPSDQSEVPQILVQKWATNAALQTFTMQADSLETQLTSLEKCFTKTGWEGYKSALDKSGNLNAIKTENLIVSANLSGTPSVTSDENKKQWTATVPLKVVYKNSKDSISQDLDVKLLIAKDSSGQLGIVQVIAAPQSNQGAQAASAPPAPPKNASNE